MLVSIHLYQIVIIIISSVMIFHGTANFFKHKDNQTILKLAVRIIIWGGMVTVAVFPNFTNFLAKLIGIQDNINAVILTGFLLVFLLIFKLLSATERLEQQVTIITRQESLKDIETNK